MLEEASVAQPKPYDWSHFIIQKAPAGVITMDGQGRITTCNPAAEEITGFSAKQIIGHLIQDSLRAKGARTRITLLGWQYRAKI